MSWSPVQPLLKLLAVPLQRQNQLATVTELLICLTSCLMKRRPSASQQPMKKISCNNYNCNVLNHSTEQQKTKGSNENNSLSPAAIHTHIVMTALVFNLNSGNILATSGVIRNNGSEIDDCLTTTQHC